MKNKKIKIMLIDNEIQESITLKQKLEEQDYKVTLFNDPIEGYNYAKDRIYDMYILSTDWSDINEIKLLKAIRKYTAVPIIIISSIGNIDVKIEAFDSGVSDYISRPYETKELIARVLNSYKSYYRTISSRTMMFDISKNEVYCNHKILQMTETEKKIMKIFMEHKATTIKNETIINDVWGWGYDGSSILKTNINRIRSKIGSEKIVTIKNVGYRFED